MIRKLSTIVVLAAVLHAGMAQSATAADPQALLDEMSQAVARLRGYRVTLLNRERIGDRLLPPESLYLKYSQGRVYLHVLSGPRGGAEAIYVPGWNGGKVRVHKGSFPDVTLNLDPHGSLLMTGQHHPIEHAGLDHLVATLLANVSRARVAGEGAMRAAGETQVGGRVADVIELFTPFHTRPVTTGRGEDVWAVARREGVDPFVLAHANGMKKVGGLGAGVTLRVPAYYGSRSVLAIDRQSHLPSRLEVYDGLGRLYEQYEWSQLDASTPLTEADFDPTNPAYHF